MKIAASSSVRADRDRVFAALLDPEVLQRCIPGCESLTPTGPDAYKATLKIGVAGLKGTYGGTVSIRDRRQPESMTLVFDGKGGPGFVRGSAVITLVSELPITRAVCDTDVHIGGVIAAVGSRLVEAAAKKLVEDFFARLSDELEHKTSIRRET
ncbi:MAG: CoxG family protein [Vicinamibacterales bacterium]